MTTKILGVVVLAMVAGCNVHDAAEPVSVKIRKADCEYKRVLPDTAEGTDTFIYRIRMKGEVQGPTNADAKASVTLLDWTPAMTCPDWGENCRRDSMETGTSPFESVIDLATTEEGMVFELYVEVNGYDEDEESWTETAGAAVTCNRGE